MRVYEVATFYTMFMRNPVGKYHVQVMSFSTERATATYSAFPLPLLCSAEAFVRLHLIFVVRFAQQHLAGSVAATR